MTPPAVTGGHWREITDPSPARRTWVLELDDPADMLAEDPAADLIDPDAPTEDDE